MNVGRRSATCLQPLHGSMQLKDPLTPVASIWNKLKPKRKPGNATKLWLSQNLLEETEHCRALPFSAFETDS